MSSATGSREGKDEARPVKSAWLVQLSGGKTPLQQRGVTRGNPAILAKTVQRDTQSGHEADEEVDVAVLQTLRDAGHATTVEGAPQGQEPQGGGAAKEPQPLKRGKTW